MNKRRPISVRQIGKDFFVKYSDGEYEQVNERRAAMMRGVIQNGEALRKLAKE